MKARFLLAPTLALAGSAYWLNQQKTTIKELTDGLAQINAMTLSSEAHDQIKKAILSQLSSLNPLAALQALGNPVTSTSSPLFRAQKWIFAKAVKEDPAFAMAWIDQNIADGKLQSSSLGRHNNLLIQLEGSLVNHLLASDLATAKKRLTFLSEENVIDILNSTRPSEDKDTAKNLILLAREALSPELASETIARAWRNSHFNDLTKISDSIRDVPFTESERDQVVSRLIDDYARNHNQESHFTEIYRCSKQEAPGQEAKLVSRVLANQGLTSPQEAFEKAFSLAESLGEPTIATGFVERVHASRGLEPIVENFKSPELAAKYRAMVSAYSQEPAATE